MDAERELVDSFLLHPDVVDTDLRVGDTTAVSRFRVWLPLDLTVTSRRSYKDRTLQSMARLAEARFDLRIQEIRNEI